MRRAVVVPLVGFLAACQALLVLDPTPAVTPSTEDAGPLASEAGPGVDGAATDATPLEAAPAGPFCQTHTQGPC